MYDVGLNIMAVLLGYSLVILTSMTKVEGDLLSKIITNLTFFIFFAIALIASAPQAVGVREFGLDLLLESLTTQLPYTLAGAMVAVLWLLRAEGAFEKEPQDDIDN